MVNKILEKTSFDLTETFETVLCLAGQFTAQPKQPACQECEAGKYLSEDHRRTNSECIVCDDPSSPAGAKTCSGCPPGKVQLVHDFSSAKFQIPKKYFKLMKL